jgi:hypothetical protein
MEDKDVMVQSYFGSRDDKSAESEVVTHRR